MPDTNFSRFWHLTLFDLEHHLSYTTVLKHFRILQFTNIFKRYRRKYLTNDWYVGSSELSIYFTSILVSPSQLYVILRYYARYISKPSATTKIDFQRIPKIFLPQNGIWLYVKIDMKILRVQEYRKTLPDVQKCLSTAFKPQKRISAHLNKNNALERKFQCFLDFPIR